MTRDFSSLSFLYSQLAAAKAWTNWEMEVAHLVRNEESVKRVENEKFTLVHQFSPIDFVLTAGFQNRQCQTYPPCWTFRHQSGLLYGSC